MILLLLFAFCNAQKWSTTGDPFNKLERKRAKLSRDMKKRFDGYARNFRKGSSLCSLREKEVVNGLDVVNQCCEWASLDCFGCNPVLLQLGIPCKSQPRADRFFESESGFKHERDCFCDSSCEMFDDCCADYRDTCSHNYLTMKGNLVLLVIVIANDSFRL